MITPTQDRILIQRDEAAKFTESGLTIPESGRKEYTGTVVAIGGKIKEDISVGTRVLFGINDGVDIDEQYCDGLTRCILMKEDMVRAVLGEVNA